MKAVLPFILAGVATGAGLFFTGPAIERVTQGGKAKAVIAAERYYAAGPVMLSGHGSTGHTFSWEVNAPHVVTDDGCCVAVQCCAPGVYTARLTVKSGGRRYSESTAVHSFQVGGVPPGPTPPPGPVPPQPTPPGPTPPGPQPGPVPDGKFGLTRAAYEAASKVNSPNRAAEARMIAGGLKGVSAQVAAGTLRSPVEIAQATLAVFDRLGESRQAWDAAIQAVRKSITKALGLSPSTTDFAAALDAVAAGLEFVQ